MPDHNLPDFPHRSSGPFSAESLRRLLTGGVLKQDQHAPAWSDLEQLATTLNRINGVYKFAKTSGNASKPQAERVRQAISVLSDFFEKRRIECQQAGVAGPSIEAEKVLYNHFFDFVEEMDRHDFSLNMDAGLLMPDTRGWRDVAVSVAEAFKVAMSRSNGRRNFGLSNDGPVPRFVAAIMPEMTGEAPTVENVGKCLKDKARPVKQGQ